jgi:serine/threonine-protein kinase RsbW
MDIISDNINFESIPDNLSKVEEFIEDVCTKYDVAPDVFGNVLVSVTEAVNNAIYHGNGSDPEKWVNLALVYNAELKKISFIVKDEGPGFDYTNLPDPTAPENITMIGGRGVFLIKQLADWVIFNDKGNSVELQFKV